jgi:hypothetical protein
MSWTANCQSTTTDTICKPERIFRNLLTIAKQKEAQDTLIGIYRSDINILTGKLNLLEEKDRNHQAIEKAYEGQVTVLNREVRRWKNKTRLAAIGGLLLAGATAWVILK